MSEVRDSLTGMELLPSLLCAAGLVVGAVLGWFVGRRSGAGGDVEAERRAGAQRLADAQANAEQRLADREVAWTERFQDLEQTAAERVAAVEQRLAEKEAAWAERYADAERAAADRVAEAEQRAEQQLRGEREASQLRLAELKADQQRLKDEFSALSSAALKANNEAFLQQAEQRLKRAEEVSQAELAKREEAVRSLVEPLAKTLGEVRTEMTAAEKARAEAHGALAEQVRAMQTSSEALRTETSQLVTALRAPQVRGRWGELQLRRVVEAAGMLSHVDFTEQQSVQTDDGLLRPDLVVHLPGEKNVVVDSKVAFNGYLEAMEAADEAQRNKRLEAHARHVRNHIDSLGAKAYWEALSSTPEFVVMFVPAEAFLNAALEKDPTLWERAFEKNVVMATPATLVALLRTVGYTWRQEKLAAEAQQVFEVGRELHKRLGTVGRHLTDLSKKLNGTVEQFNKLNKSLDSTLVTQVRRFSELQGLDSPLETPPPLEVLAVPAAKPDLYAAEDSASLPASPYDAEAERAAALATNDESDDGDTLTLLQITEADRPGGRRKQA